MFDLIYCAGKNRRFEAIALEHGWHVGVQLPNTVYTAPYFVDQNWKRPNRERYMHAVARHRPHTATVLDLERLDQYDEVLSWAAEISQYVQRIVIIPKYSGIIPFLPRVINDIPVVLGYSVPTRYGGTDLPLWEFTDRPVHLLGGSPERQMELYHYLRVVSVDMNYHQMKATRFCAYWQDGRWHADHRATPHDAPYACFARSCANITAAWGKIGAPAP